MTGTTQTLGQKILTSLNRLSVIPGGKLLFNWLIAWNIPYSASIGAKIQELKPGYARLTLKDRRAVRNHLNSIHAVALTNFGELTSGLALNVSLPAGVRGIVTNITTDYVKKARGTLTAECHCEVPVVNGDIDFTVQAIINDNQGDKIATVSVVWRLGKIQP